MVDDNTVHSPGQVPPDQPSEEQIQKILDQAQKFAEAGDYQSAEGQLIKLIDLYPKESVLYWLVAEYYEALNRADEALALYNKAIALDPDDTLPYQWRARFYERLGKTDEALADYNQAISLEPDNPYNYVDFAEFFVRSHQNDSAIHNYNRAIEKTPQDASLYLARANFYNRLGRFDEALSDYDKAIELSPQSAKGYLARAEFYRQQLIPDKLELALKDTRQACELAPLTALPYFRTGLILLDLHRYSEAIQSFDAAGDVTGERGQMLTEFYYAWATGLSAYYQGDDFNQARRYFSEAKTHLANLPAYLKDEYEIIYIAELLEAYLQLIPLDSKLKELLSQPSELGKRTGELEGLRESFSGMLKLIEPWLVEVETLLEAKRDICALLLPLEQAQSVRPENVPAILSDIEEALKYLKYGHTEELLGILKENRRRLEASQSFTPELSKAAQMDGLLTFDTTRASISEKLGAIAEVSRQKQVKISLTNKDGQVIEIMPFGLPAKMIPSVRTSSSPKTELVNVRERIREVRKAAGLIIPPLAREILLHFLEGNQSVKIETFIKDQWVEIGVYNPAQLDGFQHKQGDTPLMAWNLLVGFGLTGPAGHPPPSDADDKFARRKKRDAFRQQINDLNGKLQRLLGITDNAIIFDRPSGNYQPIINLRTSRRTAE